VRRTLIFGLLVIWVLTTGSSCQTNVKGGTGNFHASGAAAGVGIAVFLVGGGIYCIAYTEECFPDEEALQAQAAAYAEAQATFAAGLRRHSEGDPAGMEWICRSAHTGYAAAQYFYGVHLYRLGPERRSESVAWLRLAAAQRHTAADLMLRQVAGGARPPTDHNGAAPDTVEPPILAGCADGQDPAAVPSPDLQTVL
jgi:hypothetical protein